MRLVTAAAVCALAVLALSGCVQHPPPAVPTSTPTATPVFATDADALAAAKTAYAGYLAASDAVGFDSGKDPERIAPWVTQQMLPNEFSSYAAMAKAGNRFSGPTSFTKFGLERRTQTVGGDAIVVVYTCLDLSKARTLDRNNRDITPKGLAHFLALEVSFTSRSAGSRSLILERSTPWQGVDFCG
jgi:hypothetical protein